MGEFGTQSETMRPGFDALNNSEINDALEYVQQRLGGYDYRLVVMDDVRAGLLTRRDTTEIPGARFQWEYVAEGDDKADRSQKEALVITSPIGRDIFDGLLPVLSKRLDDGAYVIFSFLSYPQEHRDENGKRRLTQPLNLQEIADKAFKEGLVLHKCFGFRFRTYREKCLMIQEEHPELTNAQAFDAAMAIPDLMEPVIRVVLTKGIDLNDLPA